MGFANLICKYDNLVILVFVVVNIVIWVWTMGVLKKVDGILNPRTDKVNKVKPEFGWTNKEISSLKKKREKLITLYTAYANITAIFPLLGILGTVASLIMYSNETMMENFMVALSTTLAGVGAAIGSKIFDTALSGPLDVKVADMDYVIHEFERKNED